MKEVAVYEAKTRLSELLDAVQSGERVLITRRGVAVAQLVAPPSPERRSARERRQLIAQAFAELKRARETVSLDIPLRDAIDAGRD